MLAVLLEFLPCVLQVVYFLCSCSYYEQLGRVASQFLFLLPSFDVSCQLLAEARLRI